MVITMAVAPRSVGDEGLEDQGTADLIQCGRPSKGGKDQNSEENATQPGEAGRRDAKQVKGRYRDREEIIRHPRLS
jgi:hypothetical protein